MSATNCFYVYLLLDPRKLYLPFYVGKGKGDRWKDHMKDSNGKNSLKRNVINKIREAGFEPSVMLWKSDLTEDAAFNLEIELIARFGRRNISNGLLTNLTNGGEGISGKIFTHEERTRISKRVSGKGNPMYGRTHTDEVKLRTSERFKGKPGHLHSEEWRQHLKENNAGGKATARPIIQIGSDGAVIKEWPSAMNAANTLSLSKGNICGVAKPFSVRRCGGFWWRWVDSPDIGDGVLINHQEIQYKLNTPRIQRAVAQIDPTTGKTIRVWDSFQQASNSLNIKYATLWAAEKHNREYAGYLWKKP